MRFRTIVIILISLAFFLAGGAIMKANIITAFDEAERQALINADIPPIDRGAPAVTETATFALG